MRETNVSIAQGNSTNRTTTNPAPTSPSTLEPTHAPVSLVAAVAAAVVAVAASSGHVYAAATTDNARMLTATDVVPTPFATRPRVMPFGFQVGGHAPFFKMDAQTVMKPLAPMERDFYETVKRFEQLVPFLPFYYGTINLTLDPTWEALTSETPPSIGDEGVVALPDTLECLPPAMNASLPSRALSPPAHTASAAPRRPSDDVMALHPSSSGGTTPMSVLHSPPTPLSPLEPAPLNSNMGTIGKRHSSTSYYTLISRDRSTVTSPTPGTLPVAVSMAAFPEENGLECGNSVGSTSSFNTIDHIFLPEGDSELSSYAVRQNRRSSLPKGEFPPATALVTTPTSPSMCAGALERSSSMNHIIISPTSTPLASTSGPPGRHSPRPISVAARSQRLKEYAKPYSNGWSQHLLKKNKHSNIINAVSTTTIVASLPPSHEYMRLEDLTYGILHPCILDLKMGTQQYGINATPEKRARQQAKCAETTSASMGVRICGMQVYRETTKGYFFRDKYYGRTLTTDTFQNAIRDFLFNGHEVATRFIPAFIKRLSELYKVIESVPEYRFYGSSLLLLYDGHKEADFLRDVDMRMIDFANTCRLETSDRPDDGYLLGLRSLISVLERILEESAVSSVTLAPPAAGTAA